MLLGRSRLRFTAARIRLALILGGAGAFAGCGGSHFSAVPVAPAQAISEQAPSQAESERAFVRSNVLQVLHGHIRPEMLRAPLVGTLPLRQTLHLAIGLPVRDIGEFRASVKTIASADGKTRHRYLTPTEFESKFAPSVTDYKSIIAFVRAAGLTVERTYSGRIVLDVSGSVDKIQQAFHLTMQTRRRADGSLFYAPSKEPAVAIKTPILYVAGLDNEHIPTPTLVSVRDVRSAGLRAGMRPAAGSGPGNTYAGSDFRNAYATNVTQSGSGQCIGVLEFGSSFFPSDISSYQSEFSLPGIAPQPILLDGFNGQPQTGTGEEETALDIEVAQAMSPNISNIFVYEGLLADSMLAAMTSSPTCNQLSASWTFGVDPTSQELVDTMVMQGQSFFVSSGDGGGFKKDTNDDRDLSNTTVVGGTELTLNADKRWQSETAWSFSGGGTEKSQYKPPFQHGIKLVRSGTPKVRMVPDVAMVADNVFLIADQGQLLVASGTSISTPLWASYVSLVNQLAQSIGQPPLGFPNPPLYAIAQSPPSTNFHDIVSGSNGPFNALPKYDMVTGWGSPQAALITTLNPDPTANFTQLQFVVFTGSDDLRNDSDLQVSFNGVQNLKSLCLMRSNNGKPSGLCTGNIFGDLNGLQGWPSWSTQTLVYENRLANWSWTSGGSMKLTLTSHNNGLETNDNWDLQALSVRLSNPITKQSVTLFDSGDFNAPHNSGTCYWRFKPSGTPPTVAQTFKLLPGTTPSNGCPDDN